MVQKIPNDMLVSGGGGGSVASETHAASSKTTPVDADEIPTADSEASFAIKKLTWANIKAVLKTYFDSLYPSGSGTSTGTNTGDQAITLTGDVTGTGTSTFATSIADATVTGKLLTGYVSGAGTVAATDTLLQAVNKLNGNSASKQDALVSGTNIKTVNGSSLLGSGDLTVTGGGGGGLTVVSVTGTTQTAVAGNHYILTNVAATTVTLPASPASGDTVWVTWTNSLATNVIARNAQTIMGDATDMTLDAATNGTVQLRFVNSSWRIL